MFNQKGGLSPLFVLISKSLIKKLKKSILLGYLDINHTLLIF
ncbi:hypothetical protein C427_0897 [Paraglaciecola psychrophila 170]|uniref:Uncharacterized protein n=1 Tax=Paraglaciecola psychrophila 170 TaxID=1129794 RepID=M4RHG0_9ALTE|nr:hypothetical protein C427_0897 [Paraglaciecola psychrophila 170]